MENEVVYSDCTTFKILFENVELFSIENEYGRSTVAFLDKKYWYLGGEHVGISAAIFAFQDYYQTELNEQEIKQVLTDNNIVSVGE